MRQPTGRPHTLTLPKLTLSLESLCFNEYFVKYDIHVVIKMDSKVTVYSKI